MDAKVSLKTLFRRNSATCVETMSVPPDVRNLDHHQHHGPNVDAPAILYNIYQHIHHNDQHHGAEQHHHPAAEVVPDQHDGGGGVEKVLTVTTK